MGSAQSQSACKPRGLIPHPAINPAPKISRISVLNLMADVLGCLQRSHAGLGRADREVRFSGMPPLTHGDAQRDDKTERERAPEGGAASDCTNDTDEDRDHGVFPER